MGPLGESAAGILLDSTSPLEAVSALGTALGLAVAAVVDLTGEEPQEVMRRLGLLVA